MLHSASFEYMRIDNELMHLVSKLGFGNNYNSKGNSMSAAQLADSLPQPFLTNSSRRMIRTGPGAEGSSAAAASMVSRIRRFPVCSTAKPKRSCFRSDKAGTGCGTAFQEDSAKLRRFRLGLDGFSHGLPWRTGREPQHEVAQNRNAQRGRIISVASRRIS